jgi:CRP/FNR family transcriptional regulator, cyclic AMP receptor protein
MRPTSDVEALLTSYGDVSALTQYRRTATIFSQGDRSEGVMYLRSGRVVVTVRSDAGREGMVAKLAPGQFFGESCLAGQEIRTTTATAATTCSIRVIATTTMKQLLRRERPLADHFIAHLLARNISIERDLLDLLFTLDSTEKR